MKKSSPLWCEDCRFVCFETGLGNPMLTLNDPNGFKTTTNVYSIHLELRMALPCQIGTGKWKYVNPCLDFLGSPDQRTAYVKRQARPRWTYVRRSSVTPDLITHRKSWMRQWIVQELASTGQANVNMHVHETQAKSLRNKSEDTTSNDSNPTWTRTEFETDPRMFDTDRSVINSLRPRRNRRHFADDIFKCIFLNENEWMSLRISLKFLPKVRINNIPSLVQIMAWRRSGDKPLSESMLVSLPTHICVTRPQRVNCLLSSHALSIILLNIITHAYVCEMWRTMT